MAWKIALNQIKFHIAIKVDIIYWFYGNVVEFLLESTFCNFIWPHTGQLVLQLESSKFPTDHMTKYFFWTGFQTILSAVVTLLLTKDFGLFDDYFFKQTWNLTFLTSFTYSLTPSTFNLVDAIATASKRLFTMRPLHVWGCYNYITSHLNAQETLEQELRVKLLAEYEACAT